MIWKDLIRRRRERVQDKQSRAGAMDRGSTIHHPCPNARLFCQGTTFSQEDSPFKDLKIKDQPDGGQHSKSLPALSGPARRKTKAPFV